MKGRRMRKPGVSVMMRGGWGGILRSWLAALVSLEGKDSANQYKVFFCCTFYSTKPFSLGNFETGSNTEGHKRKCSESWS